MGNKERHCCDLSILASVIGPFGFPMYSAPIGEIYRKHAICYHFYTDDIQLYLAFKPKDEDEARHHLEEGICDIGRMDEKTSFEID